MLAPGTALLSSRQQSFSTGHKREGFVIARAATSVVLDGDGGGRSGGVAGWGNDTPKTGVRGEPLSHLAGFLMIKDLRWGEGQRRHVPWDLHNFNTGGFDVSTAGPGEWGEG